MSFNETFLFMFSNAQEVRALSKYGFLVQKAFQKAIHTVSISNT